jgi:sirohydrochlorin ferrochelatase
MASIRLAAAVRGRLPGVPVRLAFADVRAPTVADVLPELLESVGPVGEVVVLPVFLTSGYHVHIDLPAQLAALGSPPQVRLVAPLGPATALIGAAADRLRAAGWCRTDAVVLGAAGSTDPVARTQLWRAADLLGRELGAGVRIGYLAGGDPGLDEVVARLRAEGRRVAVASWLLAPGLFQHKLMNCGASVLGQPLAGHPGVTDAVLAGFRRARPADAAVA